METKRCIECEKELSVEFFYRRKPPKPTHTTLYSSRCKDCRIKQAKQYWEEHLEAHRKAVIRRYEIHRRYARYGLTVDQYDSMLKSQGGVCALCKADKPGGKGKWHIDHAGESDYTVFNQCRADDVRGILCHRCNIALGHYESLLRRIGQEKVNGYLQRIRL
jgi:hypothetical protein